MRILALILALLLYISVAIENDGGKKIIGTTTAKGSSVIEDVPVQLVYDNKNLVVLGAPKTVDVTISGPKVIVQQVKASRDFTVYMDLSDTQIGRQRVKLKMKNLSDKLKYKLSRTYAYVTVQEKVTKTYNVEAEYDKDLLASGYEASTPVVSPRTVKVTGAKNEIQKISYVKATVETTKPITETFTKQAAINVLDRNLNKLDVTVNPSNVDVTVPVANPSKTVPVSVNPIGSENNNVTIKSITTEPKKVTIYGTNERLNGIDTLPVNVDISDITKNTTIDVPVSLPDGVNKVSPEMVRATITVENKMDEKKLTGIKINEKGLGNRYDMKFLSPQSGTIDIVVDGTKEELDNISAGDFDVYVNLAGLSDGDHDVSYIVSGPKNITWKLSSEKAKIRISEKDAQE
jgi:YbbR domain-containing protein